MKIKQIDIARGISRPLPLLEQKINESLKQVFGQDVKLGICRHIEARGFDTKISVGYSAIVVHSATRGNRLTHVKLIEHDSSREHLQRERFETKVNRYLNQYDLDTENLEYVCIPIEYKNIYRVAMIKHRKKR